MAGRKPTPTALKRLRGFPHHGPRNEREPRPEPGIPDCPAELSEAARQEWDRLAPELLRMGLLSKIHRAALACACQSWADWADATEKLKGMGRLLKSPTGYIYQNPLVGVANTAAALLLRFLTEFGLTPSSQSRIVVAPAETEDEFERYMREKPAAGGAEAESVQ